MNSLHIDETNIDDVIRFLSTKEPLFFRPISISLGAALELGFWITSQSDAVSSTAQWQRDHLYLKRCVAISAGETVGIPGETYAVLPYEFFAIREEDDVLSDRWNFFLERFSRGLRENGFQTLSHAIAGALNEIATNVAQHSTVQAAHSVLNGIAAYAVAEKCAWFVVGDGGVGALHSLRTNSRWSSLSSDRQAVRAIGQDHASRRVDQGEGQGYRELFDSLASFDGVVRLRSGDGIFRVTGAIDTASAIGGNVPYIPGLQLSVKCLLK